MKTSALRAQLSRLRPGGTADALRKIEGWKERRLAQIDLERTDLRVLLFSQPSLDLSELRSSDEYTDLELRALLDNPAFPVWVGAEPNMHIIDYLSVALFWTALIENSPNSMVSPTVFVGFLRAMGVKEYAVMDMSNRGTSGCDTTLFSDLSEDISIDWSLPMIERWSKCLRAARDGGIDTSKDWRLNPWHQILP